MGISADMSKSCGLKLARKRRSSVRERYCFASVPRGDSDDEFGRASAKIATLASDKVSSIAIDNSFRIIYYAA